VGNVFVTCTVSCTGALDTVFTCTIDKAAIPANTTLTWDETATCASQDPGFNFNLHATEP
jgi:hypothetical protein